MVPSDAADAVLRAHGIFDFVVERGYGWDIFIGWDG